MRTDIRAQPRKFIIPCGPRLSPCNGRQEQAGAKLKFRRYPLQLRRTAIGWIVQSAGVCSYSERRANRAISNVRQSSLGDLSGGPHQRLKVVAIRGVDRRVEQTLTCRPDVQKEYQEQHDRDSETRVRRAPSAPPEVWRRRSPRTYLVHRLGANGFCRYASTAQGTAIAHNTMAGAYFRVPGSGRSTASGRFRSNGTASMLAP
jgi:hypothetical protein